MTATAEQRQALNCGFAQVQAVFDDCIAYARKRLSDNGIRNYIEGASSLCRLGRGQEPVLAFLEEMPDVAGQLSEDLISEVVDFTQKLARTPNAKALAPLLQSLGAAARALESSELFRDYLQLVWQVMERSSPKIHGIDSMYESPCLPDFLASTPRLFSQLSLQGIRNWADYGIKAYPNSPERQRDYFQLQSADSLAVLKRERHGTLFADHERKLDLYLRGLWSADSHFVPYSLAFDQLRKPVPYIDEQGIHLPDVYEDADITGINRYRALLAHAMAHARWTQPIIADNFSPFQRLSIETFEDARVEALAIREYPGLRALWCALHPKPDEHACPPDWSSLRHRLAMLSRALLDPQHGYSNHYILEYVERFHALLQGETRTGDMIKLGVGFIADTKAANDASPKVWFTDTEVDYRDDNRQMWLFIEEGDEEVYETKPKPQQQTAEEEDKLPPRLYPEWDYASQHYRPDWVSVYEHLHPAGNTAHIDALLAKHAALAKRLKRVIDLLKPQQKVRIRYQEEGAELDLDIALRSLIDFKSGATPDPRINMSHKHDGRSVAVSILLDLSASLADVPDGCTQSKLELSQEAVSLLAWAIEQMGDKFAIAGFHSNTRHEVRYLHLKGYSEHWGDQVKSRLAAMDAGFSTRMGAAIRHAGHYLAHQQADKKLLLILTDGEPSDIDCKDERLLIEDARIAVRELEQKSIYTYCINLDAHADDYVADIFGNHYTVIDNVARLPERLPQLFMSLTR